MVTEYKIVSIDKLQPFLMRGIRANVIDQLKNRISQGYNPARPLSVIPQDGHYIVADGNHRLTVLLELGIKEVPVVIQDGDPYQIGLSGNQDEDTYAPMDLFDWLDIIKKLRDEGLTQEKIGEKIGWSRSAVLNYIQLIDKIDTHILILAVNCQDGRVSSNDTSVTFNFTEGWFRTSGLYDLCPKYQLVLINDFIGDKFNWRKEKVQSEASKYKRWQDFIKIAESELVNQNDIPTLIQIIENNTFKDDVQLRRKIADLNKSAQNKLICGDSMLELEKIDDSSIDIVITDPPYGIDYTSNYSIYNNYVSKNPIISDGISKALKTLDSVCSILSTKTKPDAHFYIFTSWKVYPEFKTIIEKYYEIKNMIVWDKGNCSMGDLQGAWGNQHELIIFATKGNKTVKRRGDIINIPRISTVKSITSTQKPVELILELLKASAQNADTICDPFMGSGSTIKAAVQYGNLNYIGIELDRAIFEKAKGFIN